MHKRGRQHRGRYPLPNRKAYAVPPLAAPPVRDQHGPGRVQIAAVAQNQTFGLSCSGHRLGHRHGARLLRSVRVIQLSSPRGDANVIQVMQ
jgi:hypothetical protein